MARKRNKSKARKKPRKDTKSRGKASPSVDQSAPTTDVEHEVAAADEGVDRDRDAEPDVIDLDLDLDEEPVEEEEREQLIAETSALSGTAVEADSDEVADSDDEDRSGEDDERPGPEEGEAASATKPRPSVRADPSPHPDSSPRVPRLTPDALAALSAMHYEGLAILPGEFVIDLGEATTEAERDRVLAAALAHAEMQEAIYRVPTDTGKSRRFKGTIASVVFLLAIFVAARPPAVVTPEPPARLVAADRIHGTRMTLLLQAQQIEAFRSREGQLPRSLADIEAPLPGVRFVRSSNRLYQLVAYAPSGEAIVYDSAVPDAAFAAIKRPWLPAGDNGR